MVLPIVDQLASDSLAKAAKQCGSNFVYQSYQKTVIEAFQKAEKDNNFVYHAKVPEASTLAVIEKAAIAKPTPVSNPMSQNFKGKQQNCKQFLTFLLFIWLDQFMYLSE